ncbi:angiomotin-like [Dermacentor albipictus]|uniref:angiomotin-like n=1 Tax=Dermacentor albipictus TaxID=60249 RepID=UPI0038FCBF17
MNFTTKRHKTRPVVTMSQATSFPVTTAAAVTSSTAMPLVGSYHRLTATTTSVYMPLPGMHTGPALSTSVPPPGMFLAGMPAVSIASASTLPCHTPPTSIAPVSVPHRGMPLARTPSDGMAPPSAGMSPLPADMAPQPSAGMVPPRKPVATVHPATITPNAMTPAATSMAPTAMASAAMPPATALRGGMESHGMHPATLPPDNLRQAGTAPPALPPALPSVTVPPAVLPEGDTFCVRISVVCNPSDFYGWIEEKANTTTKVLEELQQELNKCSAQSEAPKEEMVNKGSFWICHFKGDKNWYRAQVLNVNPGLTSRHFRVLYLDYGYRSNVLCSSLRPLPPELTSLPAFAHRMSLAFVGPKKGSEWDHSATRVFVKETGFDVSLVAVKKGHRRSGYEDIMEVVLWKRNGPTAVNINALLVERDVALLKATE